MIYRADVERNQQPEPRCSECGAPMWRWASAMGHGGLNYCRYHFKKNGLAVNIHVDVDALAELLGDELTARVVAVGSPWE